MKRRAWLAGGVAVAAVAAGTGVGWYRSRPQAGAAEAALWASTFEQPGGSKLAMASLHGQPVLLNFWATWCAPCVKEMPMLDRFYRDQQARGWRVIGLAVDNAEPVREFLGRQPVSFPVGLAGMEGVALSLGLGNVNGGLPFTVVLSPDGSIAARKLGAIAPDDLEAWNRLVIPRA